MTTKIGPVRRERPATTHPAPPHKRKPVTVTLTQDANALLRAMVPNVREFGAFISVLLTREATQRATRDHGNLEALCAELITREATARASQQYLVPTQRVAGGEADRAEEQAGRA